MPRLVYLMPLALLVPAFLAMTLGGGWTWFLPVFAYVLVPIVDQLMPGTTRNATPEEEVARLADRFFDVLLWAVVPAQWALVGAFLWRVQAGGFAAWEWAGAVFTMMIANATYAINVGHELGHRRTKHEQWMSKALLASTLYMHFFVEHNRGHHRRVATPEDPASARRGEVLYAFWWRSVTGGMRSAWDLEAQRLHRQGLSPLSWKNETLRAFVWQAAIVLVIGAVAGPLAMGAFVVAGVGGFLLLETVNYLEHYGLSRTLTERGTYERVRPHHSWNSERWLGRIILFDLTRHSDHHAHAARKYQVLRHFDGTPELPAGYPAMILAAFIPPLFDRMMDAPLRAWHAAYDAADAVIAN